MKFEIGNKVWAYCCITDKKIFGVIKEIYKFKAGGDCVTIETPDGHLKDFASYQLNLDESENPSLPQDFLFNVWLAGCKRRAIQNLKK